MPMDDEASDVKISDNYSNRQLDLLTQREKSKIQSDLYRQLTKKHRVKSFITECGERY